MRQLELHWRNVVERRVEAPFVVHLLQETPDRTPRIPQVAVFVTHALLLVKKGSLSNECADPTDTLDRAGAVDNFAPDPESGGLPNGSSGPNRKVN